MVLLGRHPTRRQAALDSVVAQVPWLRLLAGCHGFRLQARRGGGKRAVHDGAEGLVNPESLGQQVILLRQGVHLKTKSRDVLYGYLICYVCVSEPTLQMKTSLG